VPVEIVSPEANVYKCNLRPEDMPEALVFVKIFALVTIPFPNIVSARPENTDPVLVVPVVVVIRSLTA
jgi:hypothetical protein